MNRTYKLALIAILGAAMAVPAMAQDNFPDIPENHWAFEAIARLKGAGLLVGYPDGLFRGSRLASRYEMAVAIHATYMRLKDVTDGLDKQIKDLNSLLASGSGNAGDTKSLRDLLTALQNDVNMVKSYGDDIASLKKLVDTFQKELNTLGVDVEAVKKDLSDLSDRVTALEKRKDVVKISGDANLWVAGGFGVDGKMGVDRDARVFGRKTKGAGTDDLTVLHEGAFTFSVDKGEGPTFGGTLVIGNMLGGTANRAGFGNQNIKGNGIGYSEGSSDIYLQDFAINFDTSVAGLGFNAQVGRVGYLVSPWIYQRPDYTSTFSNERWDNGKQYFDGGILGFNFGKSKLDIFGGKNANRETVNGLDIQTQNFDRTLGVNFKAPLSELGSVNLSYLYLDDSESVVGNPVQNRTAVFGGSVDFKVSDLNLGAGFSQTDALLDDTDLNSTDNTAVYGTIGGKIIGLNFDVTYAEIEQNYAAPGAWHKVGLIQNITDVKGFKGSISRKVGGFDVTVKGESWEQKSSGNGFGITGYGAVVGLALNPALKLVLDYDRTEFKDTGSALKPKYEFATLGFVHTMAGGGTLNIGYTYSNSLTGTGMFGVNGFADNSVLRGGLITTQLSVKF